MSSRTPRLLACVLCLTVAVPAGFVTGLPRAHAQDSRDNKMKEVKKACAAGEVDRAINLLAELYAETNDPIAIYNQARCYQGNGQPERAASRFREYLRKARDLSSEERAEVEGFIKEADAEAAKQRAAPAPPPPATTAPPPAPAPPPQAPPPYYYPPQGYVPPPAPPPRPVKTSRRKGMMIAGIITLGASYGLTALIGAAMRSDEVSADCNNCRPVGDKFLIPVLGPWLALGDAEKKEGGEDFKGLALTAGVAQGIGAALTTVGIILFSTSGGPKDAPAARVDGATVTGVAVIPTRGGAVGSLRAVF